MLLIKLCCHLETIPSVLTEKKKELNILNVGVMNSLKAKGYLLQFFVLAMKKPPNTLWSKLSQSVGRRSAHGGWKT